MEGKPSLHGCLLGVAIGDSLGLPFEGLSRQRVARKLRSSPLQQSLLFGKGMLSDDTEQSCLVIEAVRLSEGDAQCFQKIFARRLKIWFLALPAGVGLATVKSCTRLLFGVPSNKSGVNSAGNGAAMRTPVLGALFPSDSNARRAFVDACSVVTHSDQRAIDGARVIAEAVAVSVQVAHGQMSRDDLLNQIETQCESREWKDILRRMKNVVDPAIFAEGIGCRERVSGFVMQSVPVALCVWLTEPKNPRVGLEMVIRLGGDTDTTGAMLGSLYGASLGPNAFPEEWKDHILDYPRSLSYLEHLADTNTSSVPRVSWALCFARNVIFFAVVLAHGLRRLLP